MKKRERGQALVLVLGAVLVVAVVSTALLLRQRGELLASERAEARARARAAFSVRAQEVARGLRAGALSLRPVRDDLDGEVLVVDLNGDADAVAFLLDRLVAGLGRGADGVGFENAAAPPQRAEEPGQDAGDVLAFRRTLPGDRFASLDDLERVPRRPPGSGLLWDPADPRARAELAALRPFLRLSAGRPQIAAQGALVDLNGDPLELARLLHELLLRVPGPRDAGGTALPLGRNGVGIEVDPARPPTRGEIDGTALADGEAFSDVACVVREALRRPAGFRDPRELASVRRERRSGGGSRFLGPLVTDDLRWELELLGDFLTAGEGTSGLRPLDPNRAPHAVLAAALAVYLAGFYDPALTSPDALATAAVAARRQSGPFADDDAWWAFLAAQPGVSLPGGTAPSGLRARFSAGGPARAWDLRFVLRAAPLLDTTRAGVYHEGQGEAAPLLRRLGPSQRVAARLGPFARVAAPPAPPPDVPRVLSDPYALLLRGGRELLDPGAPLPAGATATSVALEVPAGAWVLGLRVFLPGEGRDPGVQDLAVASPDGLAAPVAWRARAQGGVERRAQLLGEATPRWLAVNRGLDPREPVLALAPLAGGGLLSLDARGLLRRWDEAQERWRAVAGPTDPALEAVRALAVDPVGGELALGTEKGRVFRGPVGGPYADAGTLRDAGGAAVPVLALAYSGGELFAGGHRGGVFRLAGAAWVDEARGTSLDGRSVGSLVDEGTSLLVGSEVGLFRRSGPGAFAELPLGGRTGLAVSDLWAAPGEVLVGTVGAGLYGTPGWTRLLAAEVPDGVNVRAVARSGGELLWGVAADGGVSFWVALEDASGTPLGVLGPARLPLAGSGERRVPFAWRVPGGTAVARAVVSWRRSVRAGATAPLPLEVALWTSADLFLGERRSLPPRTPAPEELPTAEPEQ